MGGIRIGFFLATGDMDIKSPKPLSFGYLKAYLNTTMTGRLEMEFYDGPFDPRDLDVLAVSSTSQTYSKAVETARFCKDARPEIITMIGGHHITYLPETISPYFDLGVIGEGEITFAELIQAVADNRLKLEANILSSMPGIVFRRDGELIITPRRPLINPLDSLPHPVRFKEKAQYIFSSRGCPYKCVFCSSTAFWEKIRMFSAGYVVEEIEQLLRNVPETYRIPFQDDLFVANRRRISEFADLMEKKKLAKSVPYIFSVRANLVDDELCCILKRFNLAYVAFGAESASDRMLDFLGKGTTREINQKAVDILRKHGIDTVCSFIVGIPGETEREMISTYEFAFRNMIAGRISINFNINILMPMPGTHLWRIALEKGLVRNDNFDWNRLSVFTSYRASSIPRFEDWLAVRENNGSIYMNEDVVPFDMLARIMEKYEGKIKKLEKHSVGGLCGMH